MKVLIEANVVLLYQWFAEPPELVLEVADWDAIEDKLSHAHLMEQRS